jgi:DNA modification methylase
VSKELASLEPVQQNTLVPLTQLYGHARNYRQHPPEQIKKLKSSLERFGFVRSIVAQVNQDGTYTIVAGHGIVQAAQELVDSNASYYERFGKLRTDVIPASWSPEQVSGYLLADNTLSSEAVDDEQLLATLLQEQQDAGFDLASVGSDDETLRQMLQALGDEMLAGEREDGDGGDEFDTTPEEGPTRTHVGELWQLGEHRLFVGDCTEQENIARLMSGKKIDLLWTDPPYGVSYVGKTKDALTIDNDDMDATKLYHFLCYAFKSLDSSMREGAVYYISCPDIFMYEFVGAVRATGWRQARPPVVLWIKDSFVLGRGDYHARSEPILYGWKPGAGHHQVTDRTQDNVWEIPRPKQSEDHPTMKPLELVERAINNSSDARDIVFDGFLGSGTTLIASHRTGRVCYGCELDPRYTDVILRRYEAEAGQTAQLLERQEVAHA